MIVVEEEAADDAGNGVVEYGMAGGKASTFCAPADTGRVLLYQHTRLTATDRGCPWRRDVTPNPCSVFDAREAYLAREREPHERVPSAYAEYPSHDDACAEHHAADGVTLNDAYPLYHAHLDALD